MAVMVEQEIDPRVASFLAGRSKKMLIDGRWVEAASGKTFQAINPATAQPLTSVAEAGREDINRAVEAARRAFEGVWAKVKPTQRQRLLFRLAELLETHGEELAELEVLNNGMPISTSRAMIPRVADLLRYYGGWATKIHGETVSTSAPGDYFTYTLREPVGVVGAIVPWNSPLVTAAWKLAPALATGCTVVLKPAEQTPLTSLRLGELIMEAGIPGGVVNICPGFGPTAGAALAEHTDVDKIAFTGEYSTGQLIVKASTGNLKRVSLELGGKSPDIICADADLEQAVPGAAWGIFRLSGQVCCAGSRLFVERKIYDRFLAGIADYASRIKVGNGLDPSTEMGPLISQEQLERVTGYLRIGSDEGAEAVVGGGRIAGDGLGRGFFVAPTVLDRVRPNMRVAKEEIFGPVVAVIPFQDMDEVIALSNNSRYGLAGGVWTRDVQKAHRVARALQAGVVWVNCYNVFDAAMPFGGYKMSGYGRESGIHALEEYMQVKAVWMKLT
jgi:aldehyde dehydrogenase (NAD+)